MDHTAMDEWMQSPEEQRKEDEQKMQAEWNEWMAAHQSVITESAGVGKPKRLTKDGAEDARNDIMMYSFVEADSLEKAAEIFKGHPHFGIPDAWIEVMPVSVI